MKLHLCLVLAALATPLVLPVLRAAPADAPRPPTDRAPVTLDRAPVTLDRALVTLPWSEARALLAATESPRPTAPPIAAAITAARVSLSPGSGDDAADGTALAEFTVEILAPGWQLVPLLGTSLGVRATTPAEAVIVSRDGLLCLLAHGPGRQSVTLSFDLPASLTRPGAPEISLKLAPASVRRIEITPRPGIRGQLACGDLSRDHGPLTLPASGGAVTARWVEDFPLLPTTWNVATQTLLVPGDDRLHVESRLRLSGERGSGQGARLRLPPAASHVRISGPDLADPVVRGGMADLSWATPGLLSRPVVIRYELPLPPTDEPWPVPSPAIAEAAAASTATTFFAPVPGFVVSSDPAPGSSAPPAWMAPLLAGESPVALRGTATLRAQPRLEVDTARIAKARFRLRIVADGAQLGEARLTVRHRGPLRWRFSLPRDSELLSCEIDGRATNPLLLADGELALALPSPPGAERDSEITFSYTRRAPAFAPVEGKLAVSLPATPLFVEELDWLLALPAAYEATAFEGNVEPGAPSGPDLTFHKRLVRNEAAALEIYYRKRDALR